MGFVFWPCLFNTLTTCMGFLALSSASMPVVRDLGVFSALGLLCAHGLRSASSFPDYLPFANLAVGGSSQTVRYLDDSNLDWGQDVHRALEVAGPGAFVVSRFAPTADAFLPNGARLMSLEAFATREPRTGETYVVGASTAIRAHMYATRVARRNGFVARHPPVAVIGNSIYLYRF